MKKICALRIGLFSSDVAKAIQSLPKVQELGLGESKKKAKKKKKLLREMLLRQRRLDKMNEPTEEEREQFEAEERLLKTRQEVQAHNDSLEGEE